MTICIDIYAFKRGHIRKYINAMPYFSGVKVRKDASENDTIVQRYFHEG